MGTSQLKEYCAERGLNFGALAQQLHISQGHLSDLDNGKKRAGVATCRDLFVFTGGALPPFYFLERFEAVNGPVSGFDHRALLSEFPAKAGDDAQLVRVGQPARDAQATPTKG